MCGLKLNTNRVDLCLALIRSHNCSVYLNCSTIPYLLGFVLSSNDLLCVCMVRMPIVGCHSLDGWGVVAPSA
jgi:hypothetical protein